MTLAGGAAVVTPSKATAAMNTTFMLYRNHSLTENENALLDITTTIQSSEWLFAVLGPSNSQGQARSSQGFCNIICILLILCKLI
jgi:hypothetical protein